MTQLATQPEEPRREPANAMVSMLERVLMDPTVPVERLERLLELQDKERQRQAKVLWSQAMAAAQSEMKAVLKNKQNSQTRSSYASYDALNEFCQPIYTKHGFSVTYDTTEASKPDEVRILAFVENCGYERTYHVDMPCDGKGAKGNDVMTKTHAVKSAVTYGKSTLLPMIFNLSVSDKADDDGNGASADAPRISDAQVKLIRKEMRERGVDEGKFCDFKGVERLEDMRADLFENALSNVRMKKKLEEKNA